jgi:hypothetical protein
MANVAVILVAAASATVQIPVPEHPPPLQPENVEPAAGLAERVTLVPAGKLPEQVVPQLIPAGKLVTVPLPAPALPTVKEAAVPGWMANAAVIVVGAERETEHVPMPEHPPPLQPENVEPAAGVAVRVTVVPLA